MRASALALALAALLLAGTIALGLPARAESGGFGGNLRVGLQGFTGLDPTAATDADRTALQLIYDSLGRVDPITLEMRPWAATGWSWDGDRNITVTLRRDLKFHDGTSYGAPDVAYSLQRYERGGVARWAVAVVDALTVRFDFTGIDPAAYDYRTAGRAGPGLFWTEALTASLAWDASGTRKYSGPFAVSSFTPDPNPADGVPEGSLALVPNVHHFRGRVFLNSVTYSWPYRVDLATRVVGNNTEFFSAPDDAGCALMFQDIHLIGWKLFGTDMTNRRDCVASHGGFPDGNNKSLLSADPAFSVPHVRASKNPGTDFLYFGFTYKPGSLFEGAPGSQGQMLRSAIYRFVNKMNYRDFEPNTAITHSLINRLNTPWAPTDCPPWTPCDVVVDAGFIGVGTDKRTNTGPGLLALDAARVFDRDGDGIREMSTGVPVSFRLLTPGFALDLRKPTIAADFALQLRSGGINVTVVQFDSQAALDAETASCTSCMYLARYTAATPLPDWVYRMPEVVNANDTAADLHLNLGAATSYSPSVRALHVGHVSHLVGASADFLPILHYDTLEAYDFLTFEGWVDSFDGVNNVWSLTGLRLPSLGSLSAAVSIFPERSLRPGGTTSVQAAITDERGDPVSGAAVTFSASAGTFGNASGLTGADGLYRTTYTAPGVVPASTDVPIVATISRAQYAGVQAAATLAVHPGPTPSLSVSISRGPLAVVDSNATVNVTVLVADGAGNAVPGAVVVLRADLPGGEFSRTSGTTNATGLLVAQFRAVVRQGMTYRITATASAEGFQQGFASASLSVRSDLGEVPSVESVRNVPGFEAVAALAAIGVVFALVAVARRRKDRGAPPNV